MAGETSAQLDAMAEATQHVDNAGQALAVIRGNVQAAVDATAGQYVTPAAELFRTTMAQWDKDFNLIIQRLDGIRVALTGTTRQYRATVEEEQNSANEIAALLNLHGGI